MKHIGLTLVDHYTIFFRFHYWNSSNCCCECRLVQHLWKMLVSIWKSWPYTYFMAQDSASRHIPNRSAYIYVYQKTCTRIVIATLVIIPTNWKQPKCLSLEGISLWYVPPKEYYVVVLKKKCYVHWHSCISQIKYWAKEININHNIQYEFIYIKAPKRQTKSLVIEVRIAIPFK